MSTRPDNMPLDPGSKPASRPAEQSVTRLHGLRTPLASADDAFRGVLADLLHSGAAVLAGGSLSVGSERVTREALNYSLEVSSCRDRLLYNPARQLNLSGAVGRFVWMMSGSDRLSDIAFYEPKVSSFSDDGLTIPGSNYGTRLFEARPGLNQIENIVKLLKKELNTRRAAAAIYHPEDCGRESRDIPCAFGLFYSVRDGVLHATCVMRSNNAWVLLPYNIFEFSLLAEIIAAEVGIDVGPYHHFAVSMHLYQENLEDAKRAVDAALPSERIQMPAVPRSRTWESLKELLRFEVRVRSNFAGLNGNTYKSYLKEALALGEYWDQFGLILLTHCLRKCERIDLCAKVLDEIKSPYREFLALEKDYGPLFRSL